jgi:quercetin dioxygenase-like cupin family protein
MTNRLEEAADMEAVLADAPLVVDPTLGTRYRFATKTDADGGLVSVCEFWVDSGRGVTPHIHPLFDEHFEVLENECSFLKGRDWITCRAGENALVPKGTRHAFRNDGPQTAHVVCHARPAHPGLEGFLIDSAAMGRARKFTRRFAIPNGWDALLLGAALAHGYRDSTVLLFPPMPPAPIQRLLLPPLARRAARRGYVPGRFAEALGV